jgi:hypothetical protein
MSVMTAAGQKRRAGATRRRRAVTAVPGQPNVMAGPWPGAGELPGRTAHGAPGGMHGAPGGMHGATGGVHGAPGRPSRHGTAAGPRPPAGKKEAALPSAAQVHAGRPPTARQSVAQRVALPGVARSSAARHLETGARPVRTRTRLTRRGRIVVAGLIIASMMLVAALAWLVGTARADTAGSGVPSGAVYHSLRSVVVLPGQSLWSIATQYDPGSDPRNAIQEIIDLNALSGTSVQPGQQLWLPRG